MLKFRRITALFSFLLLSTLVTSCGCGDKKEQLAADEKKLTENFKKHFTPQQWDIMKKHLQEDAKNESPAELEESIKNFEGLIETLKLLKSTPVAEQRAIVEKMSKDFSSSFTLPGFSFEDLNHAKRFFSDLIALLKNFKSQAELKKGGEKK